MDYDIQLKNYIEKNLGIKDYKIKFQKRCYTFILPKNKNNEQINIGSAGGMTRLSTGYTFLNIQEHSRYLCKNIENIKDKKIYEIKKNITPRQYFS